MTDKEKVEALVEMLNRYLHPDKFVDISKWHSGDGPFEEYVLNNVEPKAKALLEQLGHLPKVELKESEPTD